MGARTLILLLEEAHNYRWRKQRCKVTKHPGRYTIRTNCLKRVKLQETLLHLFHRDGIFTRNLMWSMFIVTIYQRWKANADRVKELIILATKALVLPSHTLFTIPLCPYFLLPIPVTSPTHLHQPLSPEDAPHTLTVKWSFRSLFALLRKWGYSGALLW